MSGEPSEDNKFYAYQLLLLNKWRQLEKIQGYNLKETKTFKELKIVEYDKL